MSAVSFGGGERVSDKIPTEHAPECPHCAKAARTYDRTCRGCYVRDLSRTPEPHRKELYAVVAKLEGREVAIKLRDDVAEHYKQTKGNYGTLVR